MGTAPPLYRSQLLMASLPALKSRDQKCWNPGVLKPVEPPPSKFLSTKIPICKRVQIILTLPDSRAGRQGGRGRNAQAIEATRPWKDALETLKGKPKVKRTMWSRRAQEYEAKINSGDLTSIAEVTRDLFRADDQPEQSYSERHAECSRAFAASCWAARSRSAC